MRKGTVRDMKKKVLQRGLFGIPTGIAIGYVITVMMSAFWGDGRLLSVCACVCGRDGE